MAKLGRHTRALYGFRSLSVPERHQLNIARQTLRYTDVGAHIMGV